MANNQQIANSLLAYTADKSASEIDNIAKKVIEIYGFRAKSLLRTLKSKLEMSDNTITVISAKELNQNQKNEIINALKVDEKTIKFHKDDTLLGGIIIKIGDRIIDNSLSSRIDNVKALLSNTEVN